MLGFFVRPKRATPQTSWVILGGHGRLAVPGMASNWPWFHFEEVKFKLAFLAQLPDFLGSVKAWPAIGAARVMMRERGPVPIQSQAAWDICLPAFDRAHPIWR